MSTGPATSGVELYELIKSCVTWLLVILGWIVVSDQQAAREVAKNCYARLQALRDDLKGIERKAVEFHTSDFDEVRVRELVRLISELATEASYLRRTNELPADLSLATYNFRKAVTFSNFDSSVHQPQAIVSPIIDAISIAKDVLDKALLEASHAVVSRQPSVLASIYGSARRLIVSKR